MAKAGFWLRGAKGKLAGAVAQKGEKGTVLRENVTPANPRTTAQMTHRVIFGTVTSAAKHMLPIIGQSFEGLPNFKENRREFIRKNLQELIKANQENETQPNCSPKGVSTIIANNYLVSNGTLESKIYFNEDDRDSMFFLSMGMLPSSHSYSAVEFMKTMYDLDPGDQLTGIFIFATGNYLYGDKDIYRGAVPEVYMVAKRITVKDDFGSVEFTLAADAPDKATLVATAKTLLVEDKSDDTFATLALDVDDEYEMNSLVAKGMFWNQIERSLRKTNSDSLIGGAMFKSHFDNGEWKYSKSFMHFLDSDAPGDTNLEITTGLTVQEAIKSYYQKYSSSDWFTRQGGDINSI